MKFSVAFSMLIASVWGQQTAQFTNTSFIGPFAVGQVVPIMWTAGNSLPVSLSISNATWSHQIFVGLPVTPSTYQWTVDAPAGFVTGSYQLALNQINAGVDNSPVFTVVVGQNETSTSTIEPVSMTTATVTYVYFDHICGCTKTGTAATPMNTGMPAITSTYYDHVCGCTKSAVVPVTIQPVGNNYTVPAAPPAAPSMVTPAPAPEPETTAAMMPTTTGAAAPATFTGEAVKLGSSVLGLVALLAAAVVV